MIFISLSVIKDISVHFEVSLEFHFILKSNSSNDTKNHNQLFDYFVEAYNENFHSNPTRNTSV